MPVSWWAVLVCGVMACAGALAGQERYDYDALGRLVRMVDAQGRVTEYVYDAVGNILEVRNGGAALAPTVTDISPSALRRGSSAAVTINGANLSNIEVRASDPQLQISGVTGTATRVTFNLLAGLSATLGEAPIVLRFVGALANVHANGPAHLTTEVVMTRLWPGQVASFLLAIGRIAEAGGSKLGSIVADLHHEALPSSPLGLDEAMAVLERIHLGRIPIAPDSVARLLARPDNKVVELHVKLGACDGPSAARLIDALAGPDCKLQTLDLDFGMIRPHAVGEALANGGLQRVLQQAPLRELRLAHLLSAEPIAQALASHLQPRPDMPTRLETLILDAVLWVSESIGTPREPGPLCTAVADPHCPLRRLVITDSNLTQIRLLALVTAAAQPQSRLESIDLRRNGVVAGNVQQIRTLQTQRPELKIALDGYQTPGRSNFSSSSLVAHAA